ncbi:hypothetical protein J1605_002954 [Eschrichtius robustus]|uniref:Uncharacterized protein n=1 Tax=Eschrichtius robustus TaxID=9764 RepID=A0AB34HTQ7_ESCRO|nr:hypothetical protein J1605_002954 [Eschrichtius robustus]
MSKSQKSGVLKNDLLHKSQSSLRNEKGWTLLKGAHKPFSSIDALEL